MPWNEYLGCLDTRPSSRLANGFWPDLLYIWEPQHGATSKSLCKISGTGMQYATIRITIDNKRPIITSVGESGRWEVGWEEIGWLDNGLHTVKVEQIDPPHRTETKYTYVNIKDRPDEPYSDCDGGPKKPDDSCGCNLHFYFADKQHLQCINENTVAGLRSYFKIQGDNARPGSRVHIKIFDEANPQILVDEKYAVVGSSANGYWEERFDSRLLISGHTYRVEACQYEGPLQNNGHPHSGSERCYKASVRRFIAEKPCNIQI